MVDWDDSRLRRAGAQPDNTRVQRQSGQAGREAHAPNLTLNDSVSSIEDAPQAGGDDSDGGVKRRRRNLNLPSVREMTGAQAAQPGAAAPAQGSAKSASAQAGARPGARRHDASVRSSQARMVDAGRVTQGRAASAQGRTVGAQRASQGQAPSAQRTSQVRAVSAQGQRQERQAHHNLWDIGDDPSPESGFVYESRSAKSRPSVQRRATSRSLQQSAARSGGVANDGVDDGGEEAVELVSERVGDIRLQERTKRLRASSRRYFLRAVVAIGIVVALVAGWAAFYNSPVFTITNVEVNGVEHLTSEEMTQLANVPSETTLLRVDADGIAERIKLSSWIQDVQINRVFPDTLQINVTERPVAAIVEIPVDQGSAIKKWAIAEDHMWLMPIPEAGSDAAKTTSSKIYEDEQNVLHIVDVPYGTKAEIGEICTDDNVNNALDILGGMTTDLAGQVVKVSAAGPAETTLELDSGVEIAFGKAEDIRDKERVIQKILEENPDGVAYINVRMVETPTWRAI